MLSLYEKRLFSILVALVLIGTLLFGREFLSVQTLLTLANQLPELGLISLALMITLIIAGLNLSVVAMVTLSGVSGALIMENLDLPGGLHIVLGIAVMILVGFLTGAINGAIISYLNVSPILVTLGTMMFYRGLTLNLTKGGAVTSFDKEFLWIGNQTIMGIPFPMILLILVGFSVYYILERREFGRQLYRIGKNRESAIYSGINIEKTVLMGYALAGIITGITAVIMTARYNSIRVDYGSSYLITAMVAVSLGGIDIKGGKGTIKGVVIALILVSVLHRILNLALFDSDITDAIMGSILLLNLLVQKVLARR